MEGFLKKEEVKFRDYLIIKLMQDLKGKATINEVIDLYWSKLNSAETRLIGWRFCVHLNKQPSSMQRKGLIRYTGKKKMGSSGIMEKIWEVTKKGKLFEIAVLDFAEKYSSFHASKIIK